MAKYIGVKMINSKPMTRQEYNDFRGWTVPKDGCGSDAGYLVEYANGGRANTERYDGYVSWSPADVFDKAYRMVDGMTFGFAIEALKIGKKVARSGWNGEGMFLFFVAGSRISVKREPLIGVYAAGTMIDSLPYVAIKTADGKIVPWLCSQTDMLADDWVLIE